ncbi:hypothetical protein ASE12_01485 [Aeromicrobium sp. Root236]|uniref:SCO7613 C-terminal domain-containing membrane protein n=1 Tax=Aeromicrobium sp. Root236 TaxID=1736498 RepID=UPI0006F3E098|nr:hypothetical protein [Aeromicrobium sp. Root236]KRC63552.1 hypothetical protein ASE12_01485 [Aeromicrobium sp. Root236]
MRFADPQACPDCRGAIAGQSTCPHCGLDLTSAEVRQLWQTLLQADELLARAAQKRDRSVLAPPPPRAADPFAAPEAAPPPAQPTVPPAPPVVPPSPQAPTPPRAPTTPPAAGTLPTYPQARPAPADDALGGFLQTGQLQTGQRPAPRQWSVGTILLTLGAFGLIVAGFIFVTRSWGDLGLVGRTLVLLGVTAAFAALGVWVTRRTLRASAEAVWTVVLALLTLDFFAARHEGMLGLDGMDVAWAWVVWGVVLVGLGIGIGLFARASLKADLLSTALAGGLGITIAGIGAANVPVDGPVDWDLPWRSILALVVAGLLALTTRPAGIRPLTITARVVVAAFFAWSYVVALIGLVDHPTVDELVGDGHGLPLVLMAAAAVVIAWLVAPVRIWAVALAVFAVCALVAVPSGDAWRPEGAWLAIAGLAAVLAVAASRGASDWAKGLRVGAIPVVAGVVLLHLGLLVDVFNAIGTGFDDAWNGSWDGRLETAWAEDTAAWVVVPMVVGLLIVAWFVPRWPELKASRAQAFSSVAAALALGALVAVVEARLALWAAVAVLLVVATALLAAHVRSLGALAGPAAAVLAGFAAALAAPNQGVSVSAWIAGALVLGGLAYAKGPVWARQVYAVAGVLAVVAGLAAAADLLDPPEAVPVLVGVVVSLALVAAAGTLLREHPVRLGVEAASAVTMFVALVSEGSASEAAVRWTIAGVVVIGLSFVVPDRRWYLWPGGAALAVAYVLLLVDNGFSFVEAYTLPFGAIGLAVGLYFVRKRPDTETWLLLGPGLTLALVPSVPQALADPTDLRALLLGLGAAAALALGIRFSWQAPFVFGVTILALLVLFNIGPYANAAPRVVLIAGVSVVLLGFGITWEDRVRDGRKLVGYVRSMR